MKSITDAEKKAAFQNSMRYEIEYAFGVPQHDPHDYCQWEMINFARMGHARVLYAFLETEADKRQHKDDVLAVDYGYAAQTVVLPDEARERLNKDLFHFSYRRLRHTSETKKWPNGIISSLLEPVLGFMKHIEDKRQDLFATPEEGNKWSALIGLLKSGRELIIRHLIGPDGVHYCEYGLGERLPDGKPILTRWYACNLPTIQIAAIPAVELAVPAWSRARKPRATSSHRTTRPRAGSHVARERIENVRKLKRRLDDRARVVLGVRSRAGWVFLIAG